MTSTAATFRLRSLAWLAAFLFLPIATVLVGCDGGPPKAAVDGTVKYKGEPVTGGIIMFSPVGTKDPGKPASGVIKSDGTFTLTTIRPGDGAIIGKHNVTYSAPDPELTEEQRSDPKYIATPSPYAGLTLKTQEVEVKAGTNKIDLELVGP